MAKLIDWSLAISATALTIITAGLIISFVLNANVLNSVTVTMGCLLLCLCVISGRVWWLFVCVIRERG